MSKLDHSGSRIASLRGGKGGSAKFRCEPKTPLKRRATMWSKRATEQSKRGDSAPSILSDDLTIEGDIVSEGEVHINGTVKGDVTARKMTLGEDGAITGAVEVGDAVIGGKLAGQLTATSVVLLSSARVTADITHVSLAIAPEAVFEGFSRRVDAIGVVAKDGEVLPPRLAVPAVQSI